MYIKKTKDGYDMGGNTYDHNYISQYLADGGDVDGVDPNKELAKLNADQKASAEKRISDYQKQKDYKEKIGRYMDRNTSKKKWNAEHDRLNNGVDMLQKQYSDILDREKNPDKRGIGESDARITEQKKATLQKLQTLMDERDKAKSISDFVSNDNNYDAQGNIKSVKKAEALKPIVADTKNTSVSNTPELKIPKFNTDGKTSSDKVAQNIQRTGSPWANSVGFNPKAIDEGQNQNIVVPGDTNTTNLGDPTEPGILGTKSDLNDTQASNLVSTAQKASAEGPDKQVAGKTWKDTLKGVDWEMLGAGAQAALGTYYLNKSGKRPMYQLDPEFVRNVDLQKANAMYGYTAEQRAELESESNGLTQQQLFSAQNYSGGSAADAYNKSRLAINDSFKRNLELTSNDQEIKQNKQANVNNLIAQKAAMKNMMFQDQLNVWSANQSAGANLLGSGIRNLINKSRLDKELAVESQANNLVNNVN